MEDHEHIMQLLFQNEQFTIAQKQKLKDQLVEYINHLLIHDFNRLVQVLYRVDVSEQKLKDLLQKNAGTDASEIITELLIERQEEKMKARKSFKSGDNIPEQDKW